MAKVAKRTFGLSGKHVDFIDTKLTSGAYGSANEVVSAGLRALQERDAAMERWLKEGAAPTYDAMKANRARRSGQEGLLRRPQQVSSAQEGPRLKHRDGIFSPDERHDLPRLYDWISSDLDWLSAAIGSAIRRRQFLVRFKKEPIEIVFGDVFIQPVSIERVTKKTPLARRRAAASSGRSAAARCAR